MINESVQIEQGKLYQIRHQATKLYLKGTIHFIVEKKLFSTKELDEYYLGTSIKEEDFYTYFIFEKYLPTDNNIELGNIVSILNYGQQYYVSLNKDKKSEVTNQCYAYLGQEKHYFIIQPEKDVFASNINSIETSIKNNLVRFTSIHNGYSLHSHFNTYKTEKVAQYHEVTGYKNQDENDLWEIIPVKENSIKNFIPKIKKYEPIQIFNEDIIILRNFWTGWALHSHQINYRSSKAQEVTLACYEREQNDLWIITKLNIKENDDGIIRRNDEIVLQHKQTKKFLSWSNFLTYSQSGYQVQGLNSKPITGFQLEYFENQPLRVNSPFLIKIINKNLYLSQQNIQTESKAGSQKEAAFVQKFSGSCLWVVESRNK
ncbi:unnamed protein product [Paramecium sonneborni]|uniref:MIR domain-containing protein n=1 Tax=Paramecium sonneborni TaxID=65129 RepID=A0A8S1KJH5_9CILI|nr:unnamed protein product [Paramecium sonneborni]